MEHIQDVQISPSLPHSQRRTSASFDVLETLRPQILVRLCILGFSHGSPELEYVFRSVLLLPSNRASMGCDLGRRRRHLLLGALRCIAFSLKLRVCHRGLKAKRSELVVQKMSYIQLKTIGEVSPGHVAPRALQG